MSLKEHLAQYRGKTVHVLINPGNAGDGLIHLAGRELLSGLGIRSREFLYPAPATGDTLLIHGCGGFGGVSAHRVEQSRFYFDRFKDVVILPSSFDPARPAVLDFLATLPEHVTVFCREKISYDLALQCAAHPEKLFLSEDVAFLYDYGKWVRRRGKGTLVCFRTDSDSAQESRPSCSIDISKYGDKHDAWPLLFCVSLFEEVHTDRMHVGIAAAMMNKQTYYYDNNYHKIRATYAHSMTAMENVHYMGRQTPEVAPSAGSRTRMRLLHVLMKLRKPAQRVATHFRRRRYRRADPPVTG
jgi:exopolysaccharide biosynthesis predicted pyruvyltransferase EpsI